MGLGDPLADNGLWPNFEPGTVWLAGAGPGDPGLVTLHCLNGLRQADVIVYDALVEPRILDFARPGAKREYAGKRGGRPNPDQRDISVRLIALAQQNLRVLRLKGGDPFIFGRGGEEALALVEAGIRFRIIPGITAGIGGLAYAGIPMTFRDVNHAVTLVTGNRAGGEPADLLDWTAIAKGSPVIVVYMATQHLEQIANALIAAGRSPTQPAALVSRATLPDQIILKTTLGNMSGDLKKTALTTPILLVIGDVVALADSLRWFGLSGPREAAS